MSFDTIQLPTVPASTLKGSIVGLCNALLDLTAEVTPDYLQKYGLEANNAILAEDRHLPLSEDLVSTYSVKYSAGGAGQNSMRAAQSLLPPGSTLYYGCVGEDNFASQLQSAAEHDGLEVHYSRDSSKPTGSCACLLTSGGKNRSLVAHLGAATSFTASFLSLPEHETRLRHAMVYYVTGFMITVSPESAILMATHALRDRKVFALNISAPYVCHLFNDKLRDVYQYADLVFGNETEAMAFAKVNRLLADKEEPSLEDLPEIAKAMALLPKMVPEADGSHVTKLVEGPKRRIVVITQGPKESYVSDGASVRSFAVEPLIDPELVVDTNGAGDAFVGGFLSQVVQNKDLETAMTTAFAIASDIIRTSGIQFKKRHPSP